MLTTEQQNQIAQHLNTRAQRPRCPVCGTTSMRVKRQVIHLPTADEPEGESSDPSFPRVIVTCRYCGYDMYFDPAVIGLSLNEDPQDSE